MNPPKDSRICHGFLQGSLALAPVYESERLRSRNQTFIVTGKLHVLLLRTDKFKRRKVNGASTCNCGMSPMLRVRRGAIGWLG
jgi:hypothetical protein